MNEMNEIKTPATEAAAENAPKKQHFSPVDAIFALLFFVFGDLTVRWFFFVHDSVGIGTFVLVAVITALTLSYLKLKKIPLTWKSTVPFGVILLFSTVLFLSDNDFIKMIAVSFAVIAFLYAVLAACKNGAEEKMGDLPQWEGDRIILALLGQQNPFFSLKLVYEGETLVYAALDGRELTLN